MPDPAANSDYLQESRAALQLNSLNRSTWHLLPRPGTDRNGSAWPSLLHSTTSKTHTSQLWNTWYLESLALLTRWPSSSLFSRLASTQQLDLYLRLTFGTPPASCLRHSATHAQLTPSSLHSTTLVSGTGSLYRLADPRTHSTLDLPAPTNSQLDHFTLGSPSEHRKGHACCAMQHHSQDLHSSVRRHQRARATLHCTALSCPISCMYFYLPFSGKGSATGLQLEQNFSIFFGSAGLNAERQKIR